MPAAEKVFPVVEANGLAIGTVELCHQDCAGTEPVPNAM